MPQKSNTPNEKGAGTPPEDLDDDLEAADDDEDLDDDFEDTDDLDDETEVEVEDEE